MYQLVLKHMKLLPYHTYTKEAWLKAQEPYDKLTKVPLLKIQDSVAKGKRKADSGSELEQPAKRAVTIDVDGDMEM